MLGARRSRNEPPSGIRSLDRPFLRIGRPRRGSHARAEAQYEADSSHGSDFCYDAISPPPFVCCVAGVCQAGSVCFPDGSATGGRVRGRRRHVSGAALLRRLLNRPRERAGLLPGVRPGKRLLLPARRGRRLSGAKMIRGGVRLRSLVRIVPALVLVACGETFRKGSHPATEASRPSRKPGGSVTNDGSMGDASTTARPTGCDAAARCIDGDRWGGVVSQCHHLLPRGAEPPERRLFARNVARQRGGRGAVPYLHAALGGRLVLRASWALCRRLRRLHVAPQRRANPDLASPLRPRPVAAGGLGLRIVRRVHEVRMVLPDRLGGLGGNGCSRLPANPRRLRLDGASEWRRGPPRVRTGI